MGLCLLLPAVFWKARRTRLNGPGHTCPGAVADASQMLGCGHCLPPDSLLLPLLLKTPAAGTWPEMGWWVSSERQDSWRPGTSWKGGGLWAGSRLWLWCHSAVPVHSSAWCGEGDEYVFVDWLLNELQHYLFLLKHEKEPKYLSIWSDVSREIPGSPYKEQGVCWY